MSCKTNQDILAHINKHYVIHGETIRLHRAGAGNVYFIQCPDARKVLKLCRPVHTDEAVQAVQVISYLEQRGFPIVKIVPARDGAKYITVPMPDGDWIGILFDYLKGRDIGFLHRWRNAKQPLIHPKTKEFARQVGAMHRLMNAYPSGLIKKGRERYVDGFVAALRRDGHEETIINDIQEYGNAIWANIEKLPRGFCHGDMHPGNTVYHGGRFTWMDFDRVSISHPMIDIGWLSDASDFNQIDDGAVDRSRELFDVILSGYSLERTLTEAEISAVFDAAALIHYDLFSSFVSSKNGIITKAQAEEQRLWLMRWRELSEKRR